MKNRIREIREQRGWSQDQLAVKVGTSSQQISRLERTERGLTDEWLGRLAAALDVRKADLIFDRKGGDPSGREFTKNEDEFRILQAWRDLSVDRQALFRKLITDLAPTKREDAPSTKRRKPSST